MGRLELTAANPVIVIPITPPADASQVFISGTIITGPPYTGDQPAARLLHLRTHDGLARDTEICEIAIRNHKFIMEFNGFGGKQREARGLPGPAKSGEVITSTQPQKIDFSLEYNFASGKVSFSWSNKSSTLVGETFIKLGSAKPFELVVGMPAGTELVSPLGWAIEWDDSHDAIAFDVALATPPGPSPVPSPVPSPPPASIPPGTQTDMIKQMVEGIKVYIDNFLDNILKGL